MVNGRFLEPVEGTAGLLRLGGLYATALWETSRACQRNCKVQVAMSKPDDIKRFLEVLGKARSRKERADAVRFGLQLGLPLSEIEELLDLYEATCPRNSQVQPPLPESQPEPRPTEPESGPAEL
jgi:hypothetical protein